MMWKPSILPAAIAVYLLVQITAAQVVPDHDVRQEFTGHGSIHVLNTTNLTTASPANDRIGCLNAHGLLTLNDCAIFARLDSDPHTLSTVAGGSNCSFRNPAMPLNTRSVYGGESHAWSCWDEPGGKGAEEWYYTVHGFNYPFVCNGNLNCYYNIVAEPVAANGSGAPVWEHFWGSQQMGAPPGELQVLWLWVPVPKEGAEDHGEE